MLSDACATMIREMSAAPQEFDAARYDRALDRLAEHCELQAMRTAAIEERRTVVRARLEHELGSELTHRLLTGLAPAA
jgi:hypothetical protein